MKPENRNRSVATGVAVLVVAVVLLAIDQISKYFVLTALKPVGTVTVIPGLLELTYVENTGAAFGLFKNAIWLVIAVTVIAAAVILVLLFRYKHHSFFSYTTSALLIAGGLGNLIDRIVHGFVVDFIHAVSYTHLDVYKRQPRLRAAPAPLLWGGGRERPSRQAGGALCQ